MKTVLSAKIVLPLILAIFLLLSCSSDDDNTNPPDGPQNPDSTCFVHLFDGDNYSDDNIIIEGPGEFSNLQNLPGSDKDWNDEADSFKSGENTTVTFWTKTNFEGDSITYGGGAQEPSIDEPSSMRITCYN